MATVKKIDNKDILIRFYKSCALNNADEESKDNRILKRYKKIHNFEVGNPAELILDIVYTKKYITFVTADFKKFTVPFTFIRGWNKLNKKDKYDIRLEYASIFFGDDKLFFPFDEVLYHKNPKYKARRDKENAPYRKKLGIRVREIRKSYGKRQADIKGISERELSRIENGIAWPTFKSQQKIAQGLGISFARFRNELYG